jgi:2,3-bisphosphoglycerate-independent phosphoglycerate mutase
LTRAARSRHDYDSGPSVGERGIVVRLLTLVLPGLADAPLAALSGKTPLEVAGHPALDRLAARGRLGTVRIGLNGEGRAAGASAGSIVGLPALLGIAGIPKLRRGPLEAAGLGVALRPDDLVLRLNFVSTFNGALADTRAGHVSDQEAALLLDALRTIDLGGFPLRLHAGAGYRHLAVIENGARLDLSTVAPQEVLGRPLRDHLPRGRDAAPLVRFLEEAERVLKGHEVNRVRVDLGENPADAAWLWGEGVDLQLPPLGDRFGGPAAMVAAAPLVRGLGVKLGMTTPPVEGATADERSDLAAKAAAAQELASRHALVVVHAAAINEATRSGDAQRKVAAIEKVDRDLVAPLLAWVEADAAQRRILVTSDHGTSVESPPRLAPPKVPSTVPFVLLGGGLEGVRERRFTEETARAADLQLESAADLLDWYRRPGTKTATA